MMDILMWILIFVASMIILIKASEYLTKSAETLGLFFRMPTFIVGVTILAIGTSFPELISGIISVIKGSSEIVIGNVAGANITNIFLGLGLVAIFGKKIIIAYELRNVDLPFLIGSALMLAATVWDGVFTRPEAIICLLVMVAYISYTLWSEKGEKQIKKEVKGEVERKLKLSTILTFFLSMVFIYIGAEYTIQSVIKLSEFLNIGKEIIAVGIMSFGTTLPELTVSLSAVLKGKGGIAVGNLLGSNIFNSLAVMGIPGLIGVLVIPHTVITFILPMMIIATMLYFVITFNKNITRWEGFMLVLFYILFIGKVYGFF